MIRIWRWGVLILTAGIWATLFIDPRPADFGAQFRYLTVWGLTASVLSAWLMVRVTEGWTARRHDAWAGATVVLNGMVLLLYWRLYLTDPRLLYGETGQPGVWWQEYFLHGLGPVLQMTDAIVIHGVFRRLLPPLATLMAIVLGYVAWLEAVIRPLNATPTGAVTDGLPYPFLNDLTPPDRAAFYATTIGTALLLFALAAGLAWLLRRGGLGRQAV